MADFVKLSWLLVAATIVLSAVLIIIGVLEFEKEVVYFVIAAVLIVTLAVTVTATMGRKTDARLEYDGLTIRGAMHSTKTPYGDIASIEMRDKLDFGIRVSGYGGVKWIGGKFRNKEFGVYDASLKMDVKKYIIVKRRNGKILVFNLETEENTVQFYDKLAKRTGRTRE
jgi:hypothetical protein